MYFKFRGIDSRDMGVTVLRRPNIISPEMRTWTTFIDGKDGAYSHPMGLKPNSFNFTIAVEDVENIDKVLGWLTGRGRFIRSDLPNRYLNVHINEGVRLHRTVEWLYQGEVTVQVVDPFWYSVKDEWQEYKPNLIRNGWKSFSVFGYEGNETQAPIEVFEEGYGRNLFIGSTGWTWGRSGGVNHEILKEYLGKKCVYKLSLVKDSNLGTVYTNPGEELSTELEVGKEYILSFLFTHRGEKGANNTVYLSGNAGGYQKTIGEIEEGVFHRHYVTIIPKREPLNTRIHINFSGYEEIYICEWKLEEGTEVTEWTPAWEDLPKEDKPVRAWDNVYYYREDLGEGKTRIRFKGGNHRLKMLASIGTPEKGELRSNTFLLYSTKYPLILHNQIELTEKEPFEGEEVIDLDFKSSGRLNFQMRLETNDPQGRMDLVLGEPYAVEGLGGVLKNEGNYYSKPLIKLVKGEGKSVTIKTKDSYLTYTFPNRETEVEIDTTTKTATYNGETRDRFVDTDAVEVEFPPGPIDVQVEGGTAYFKKKDRWI